MVRALCNYDLNSLDVKVYLLSNSGFSIWMKIALSKRYYNKLVSGTRNSNQFERINIVFMVCLKRL